MSCDPEDVEQAMYNKQIKDLDADDLIVFHQKIGPVICMSREQLLMYWNYGGGGEHGNGWLWGDCKGSVTDRYVHPEKVCKKYYKVPATNQRVFPMVKKMIEDNPAIKDWIYGEKVKDEIKIGNEIETIYSVCPKGKVCTIEELQGEDTKDEDENYVTLVFTAYDSQGEIVEESKRYNLNTTELRLSNKRIITISDSLYKLKNLTMIDISFNSFESLPLNSSNHNLTKLSKLYVNNNKLTSLPDIRKSRLSQLDLSNNDFTAVPESVFRMRYLETLNLSDNKLTSLPREVFKIGKLKVLNLNSNELTSLPSDIGKLTRLSDLSVQNNKLTSLPDDIGKLSSLSSLSLQNNLLTSLPESISKLVNLKVLNLDNNKLHRLPKSIASLPNLKNVSVKNTSLVYDKNEYKTFRDNMMKRGDVNRDLTNIWFQDNPKSLIYLYKMKGIKIEY